MNLNIQYNYLKFKLFADTKTSYLGVELTLLVIKSCCYFCNVYFFFFLTLVKGNKTITWTFADSLKLTENMYVLKVIFHYNSTLEFSL